MNIFQYIPQLLKGILITLELTGLSLFIGLVLALFLTLLVNSRFLLLRGVVHLFLFIFRGSPLLVQIFLIYYGIGQWHWIQSTVLWVVLKTPMGCATLALALNTAAYTTVLLKAGIQSIPFGEIEACYALGFATWKMYSRIILPRAIRIAWPAYSNEVVIVLKGTSLVSTITIMDLMGVTQHLIDMTYETIPLLILAGVIYLLLNSLIMGLFGWVEKKQSVWTCP
jgi:arginine transport system permease protein